MDFSCVGAPKRISRYKFNQLVILPGFVGLRDRLPVDSSILSPLFRLLGLLEKRKSTHVEDIDAVLICPVSLPAESVHQRFKELDIEKKSVILSSWFHCVNWFRELLNSFSGLIAGSADYQVRLAV